jgi:prepilin-type N-terminal cleavage/methylation domain-containing protein
MKTHSQKGERLKRHSTSGFSLVEVVIAMSILAVAFFGMIATITYTTRSNETTKERLLAMRAAEKQVETMLSGTFSTIYANYVGKQYDIEGLPFGWKSELALGRKVMVVEFPTGPLPGGGTGLAETKTGAFMELTDSAGTAQNLDLNGDTIIADTATANNTYKILPVKITIRYVGVLGQQEFVYRHIFLSK